MMPLHKRPFCMCCKTNRVRKGNALFCKNCNKYIKVIKRDRPTRNEYEGTLRRVYVYSETFEKVKRAYEEGDIKTPNNKFNFPCLVEALIGDTDAA